MPPDRAPDSAAPSAAVPSPTTPAMASAADHAHHPRLPLPLPLPLPPSAAVVMEAGPAGLPACGWVGHAAQGRLEGTPLMPATRARCSKTLHRGRGRGSTLYTLIIKFKTGWTARVSQGYERLCVQGRCSCGPTRRALAAGLVARELVEEHVVLRAQPDAQPRAVRVAHDRAAAHLDRGMKVGREA
jgi:hypothetical protein